MWWPELGCIALVVVVVFMVEYIFVWSISQSRCVNLHYSTKLALSISDHCS